MTVDNASDLINAPDTSSITALIDNDGGDGISLREAIVATNNTAGADEISFDEVVFGSEQKIDLISQLPKITDDVTITGPSNRLTLDAGGGATADPGDGFRIFELGALGFVFGPNVTIRSLNLTGGDVVGDGGAIDNSGNHPNLTLTNVHISGNTASGGGGGIFNYGYLNVTDSTISDNTGGRGGGGIANLLGIANVTNSTISGNTASGSGGGISTYEGKLTIINSTISGNSALNSGGGISMSDDFIPGYPAVIITDSTISNNTAMNGFGGGIRNWSGQMLIQSSTITANTAPAGNGSGVASFAQYGYRYDGTFVSNSIISGNTNEDLATAYPYPSPGTFRSDGFNLIGSGGFALDGFNLPTDQTGVTDPLLGPLADNGGPTKTHALLLGSPAIDSGSSEQLHDQRGAPFVRSFDDPDTAGSAPDIGSFERQTLPGDFDSDGDWDIDDLDLLYRELGGADPLFNLDGFGLVSNDDVTTWLQLASAADTRGRTFLRGDANLDGNVSGGDYTVMASHFGGPGRWADGNFVVDAFPGGGRVTGPDFGALAANFGFTSAEDVAFQSTDRRDVDGASSELPRTRSVIEFGPILTRAPQNTDLPVGLIGRSHEFSAFKSDLAIRNRRIDLEGKDLALMADHDVFGKDDQVREFPDFE